MSNTYSKNNRNRRNNNFGKRLNKSYYENYSWSIYNPYSQHRAQNNRSQEWLRRNWQQIQTESCYNNQNFYNFGNYRQNRNNHWHREQKTGQSKHILDGLSQEIKIKHINKFKEYLEDDEKIYLDFKDVSLHESSYVYNLRNLSYDSNEYYESKMKEAISCLCDILKVVESKLHLEVTCEECSDQNLRNVTYTKVLKNSNDKSMVKNSDSDRECNENVKLENSNTEVKIIMKEDLYRDLDVGYNIPTKDTDNVWTQGLWINYNKTSPEEHDHDHERMTKLLETFSTPVESNKGRRMMEKMGWKGGALGVNEGGIIDPIVPNVTLRRKAGLGHTDEPETKKLKETIPKNTKMLKETIPKNTKKGTDPEKLKLILIINVLRHILSFLCDDELTEISFDHALSKRERYKIHCIIGCLTSGADIDYHTVEQMVLISEIQQNMAYILEHESEGQGVNRKLYLYKVAPENIFLITPKDLNEKSDEENYGSMDKSDHTEIVEPSILPGQNMSTENMGNLSIDNKEDVNGLNRDCKNKSDSIKSVSRRQFIKESLTSYIKEFCEDKSLSELRFLGKFNTVDSAIINEFMADLAHDLQNHDVENRKSTKDLDILYVNEYYDFDVYLKERKGSILYVLRKMKKTAKCTQKMCK